MGTLGASHKQKQVKTTGLFIFQTIESMMDVNAERAI
jgi:hypothetical protein